MSNMRIVFPLLIIAVVVISHLVVGRVTQRRANERLERISHWRHLPTDDRLLAHTEFTKELICDDADRARNAWTFCLSVAAAGLLMIVWLDDNTTTTNKQAVVNCENFRELVDIQNDDYTREIRRLTEFLELPNPADRFRQVPGYEDLPRSVQRVIEGLASQQQASAEEELQVLRSKADTLRDFRAGLDCPGS